MAKAKGHKQTVNHTLNQISHISMFHADGDKFTEGLAVRATGSDGSKYEHDVNKIVQVSNDKKRAVARLKCTHAGRGTRGDLPVDGKLTVTVIDGPLVDPIDVTYVDDVP